MANSVETRFLHAVRESYAKYNEHGARSNEKLKPLHQWISDELQKVFGEEYEVQSLRKSGESSEATVPGKYYEKTVDIAIAKTGAVVAIVSVKFVTSNFKQNANNYFEHLMGETANLRRKDIIFGYFMVLPAVLPYFKRGGKISHEEKVRQHHLDKYVKLAQDDDHPHKPDVISIGVINLPLDDLQNTQKITLANPQKMPLDSVSKTALANEFSVSFFFHKMYQLVTQA